MKSYIVDASVILTFLLETNRSLEKNFTKFLKKVKADKAKFHSSYLLPLEVGNGLRYSLLDEKLANEVFQKFSSLPIQLSFFSNPQLTKILQLSYRFKSTFYDTSYHYLAKFLKGIFLTADSEYYKKAKKFGQIELL